MMVVRKRRDLYCQLCSFITGNFYPTLILGGGGITWPPGSAVWLDEFINFTNCLTTDWLGVGDQEVSVSLNKYKYWSTWLNVNLSLNSQHQSQLHLQTSPLKMQHQIMVNKESEKCPLLSTLLLHFISKKIRLTITLKDMRCESL